MRSLLMLLAVMTRRSSCRALHVPDADVDTTQDVMVHIPSCNYQGQSALATGFVCALLAGSPFRDKPSNFTIVAVVSSAGSLLLLFLGLAYARFKRMLLW